MATKKEKKVIEPVVIEDEIIEDVKTYQEQLNEVDGQIAELQVKKKDLAKLAAKEVSDAIVMPLHQLNLISSIGYEKAKAKCGAKWVE